MLFGKLSILFAMISALFAAFAYYRADKLHGSDGQVWQDYGRKAFYLELTFIALASFYFLYLILTHHFEVSYIYRYSSRDLSPGLLISSFWAGQEGSFLFWAISLALMIFLARKRFAKFENPAMLYLNLIMAGFLIILVKVSPFALQPQTPPDGAGLNPLLQNFWMVIHPPVLFLGYAAAAIPFALALAALQKNDYDQWIQLALPWSLFTSVTLGAGIIIGGFWAYEVLGWGGYWGWDPVENSSLIAWLVIIALFHGLLITKKNGALQRSNILLAILAFFMVLYATFLTRSGILADFSVHSFEDLGISAYLILFMGLVLLLGFGLLIRRYDEIDYAALPKPGLNKETALLVTMVLFLTSALLTWVGTSSPLLTSIFSEASQVQSDFYNRVNLPLGILMALVMALAPFMHWKYTQQSIFLKRLAWAIGAGILMLILLISVGFKEFKYLLFLVFSAMALAANLHMFLGRLRHSSNKGGLAAPITHLGVGLIFLGIILSAYYSKTERLVLTQNEPKEVFDASLTYTSDFQDAGGKNGVIVQVQRAGKNIELRPRIYMNNYMGNMMHEPAIQRGWIEDLYLSPLQVARNNQHQGHEMLTIGKGQSQTWHDYEIHFTGFDMQSHGEGQAIQVFAKLEFVKGNKTVSLRPGVLVQGQKREPIPEMLEDDDMGKTEIILNGINADQHTIELMFHNQKKMAEQASKAQVLMEVSLKRFISLIWLGAIILIIGTIIGGINRFKERKRS